MASTPSIRIQMPPSKQVPRVGHRPPRLNLKGANTPNPNLHPSLAGHPLTAHPLTGHPLTAHPLTGHPLTAHPQTGHPLSAQTKESEQWPFFSASDFARGFSDFVDFTKAGMSFGEKFTFGLYDKVSKWSKKWFTHIFLFIIMVLYSAGGAMLFVSIEGGHAHRVQQNLSYQRREFLKAMSNLANDPHIRYNRDLLEGQILITMRDHKDAVTSFLNNDKTFEQLEKEKNPWTFMNSMFFCGTIYTTIEKTPNSKTSIMDQQMQLEGVAVRRRHRKLARPQREKTPDPTSAANSHRHYSEDESSAVDGTTASEETTGTQTVRMQIRPPGTMSAHESKILRRRDKTFATSAARSLSQPREAERLTSPEADELIRTVKHRSLSSPRHKDESSEGELIANPIAPVVGGNSRSSDATNNKILERHPTPLTCPTVDENLSRLEQNLRRFEEERKRFESDKRHFEREKREHRLRYKQLHDSDERKRLLQSYRKLSDRIQLPSDAEERRRVVHSLRLQRNEAPALQPRHRHSGYDESSTQFSSSEELEKPMHPVRRQVSANAGMSNYVAGVRGPPPQPPERQNQSVSRNHSLSPIRPQRRSRTPEQRAEIIRRLTENEANNKSNSITPEPQTPASPEERHIPVYPKPEPQLEANEIRRRHSTPRKDSLTEIAKRRKQSLQRAEEEAAMLEAAKAAEAVRIEEEARKAAAAVPLMTTLMCKLVDFFSKRRDEKQRLAAKQEVHFASEKLLLPQDLIAEDLPKNLLSKDLLRHLYWDVRQQWRHMKTDFPQDLNHMRLLRNKCIVELVLLILLCGFGGLMFRYTEGTSENIYKCEVRKVKRDFIDNLWDVSHNMREDDWKLLARQKLRKFEEELNSLAELGIRRYPGQKSWNFVNCILFCWTVITKIGYGHIAPVTDLGRTLAIIYAIIGIPLFLLILADYGKLFTRALKFFWVYVRRLYYTGTCRNIRRHQSVRDAMKFARRSSMFFSRETDVESRTTGPETPSSPFDETFEIDDEFNLPISVASTLLISYILIGALFYSMWEDWTYFEAFYFVFISMSTIGFGDLVPKHPIFMMCSTLYLIFGLALTSMFINVVQIKLSDTFKQASIKLSTTIGIELPPDENDEHPTIKEEDGEEVVGTPQQEIEIDPKTPPSQLNEINLKSSMAPPRPAPSEIHERESPPPLPSRKQEVVFEEKKKGWRFW